MHWQYTPYLAPLLIAGMASFALALFSWRSRQLAASTAVCVVMSAVAEWSVVYALEIACRTLPAKVICGDFEYLGIATLPVAWLVFVLQYSGQGGWLTRRRLAALYAEPCMAVAFISTNPVHHLFYSRVSLKFVGSFTMMEVVYGPLFWVNFAYCYSCFLVGTVLCFRAFLKARDLYRGQTGALLMACLAPGIANLLYVSRSLPFPWQQLDLTPFGFTLTGAAIVWGMARFRLLGIMPVARGAVLDGMSEGVIVLDQHDRVVDLNPAAERMFGCAARVAVGKSVRDVVWQNLRATAIGADESIEAHDERANGDYRVTRSPLRDTAGRIIGSVQVARDVTDRKQAQRELAASEEKYRTLFSTMTEGMAVHEVICDDSGKVVDYRFLEANPAFETLTGKSRDSVIGHTALEVFPELEPEWIEDYGRVALTGDPITFERHAQTIGRSFRVMAHSPRPGQFATLFSDITDRRQAEDRLSYLAFYDELTALPNRFLFSDHLSESLTAACREGRSVAVLFLDLDRFKEVNDTLGHSKGDMLLKVVAARLAQSVRESDTVARMSGDEFVLVLPNLSQPTEAAGSTAQRILSALSQPFSLDGHEVYITASIGISLGPKDGESVDVLMKNADIAMYRAKDYGRNTCCFFSEEMRAALAHRRDLEHRLRKALDNHEFQVYYQAQVDGVTGRVFAAEALLRWTEPELGEISPGEFIGIAEETGQVEAIGEWVLRTACADLARWHASGLRDLRVAVNLSVRQFERPDIIQTVERVLADTCIPASSLELEITESTAMRDTDRAEMVLRELRALGVRIALDDFGTGHCSFGYLKRFPVHTLKIDRTFIRDILSDPNTASIVHALTILGRSMGLSLIAECVETPEQFRALRAQGCEQFQGYLFARAAPAEEFMRILADGMDLSRWIEPEFPAAASTSDPLAENHVYPDSDLVTEPRFEVVIDAN